MIIVGVRVLSAVLSFLPSTAPAGLLTIRYTTNVQEGYEHVVAPALSPTIGADSKAHNLAPTVSAKAPPVPEKVKQVGKYLTPALESIDPFKKMFVELAKVHLPLSPNLTVSLNHVKYHPFASVAWGLFSSIHNVSRKSLILHVCST